MKPILFSILIIFLSVSTKSVYADAQTNEAYVQTITKRADKIVATLGIVDSVKYKKVLYTIRDQYSDLNDVYKVRDERMVTLKEEEKTNREATAPKIQKLNAEVDGKIAKLHKAYLSKLSKQLNGEQIEKVKDGMTYGVLPLTYKAYQDMILTLTAEQKAKILSDLTEAREHAMDAENSDKKHAWFGKYKGRINNYLSAQGYNLNQAQADWKARREATTK